MQRFALMKPVLSTLVWFGLGVVTAAADAAVLATSEDVAGCRYVGGVLGGSAAEVLKKARRYGATHVVYTEKKVDSLIRRGAVIGEGAAYRCNLGPVGNVKTARGRDGLRLLGFGSGFVVSREGHLITNYHVVRRCTHMRITNRVSANVLGTDPPNDLALLQGDLKNPTVAVFRGGRNVRTGQDILLAGFPLPSVLGTNLHVTRGSVSTLAGLGNNSARIQISAPAQPGNSGGPVLDFSGHVVGVVYSVLRSARGRQTQNTNFAIRAGIVRAFLEAHGVSYETAPSVEKLAPEDVADRARKFTFRIECWG